MTLSYCVKQKKHTESVDEKPVVAKNGRPMMQSVCAECGAKKTRFVQSGGLMGSSFMDLAMTGLIQGSKLAASKAIKSDFAKNKIKGIANKYLDQAINSVTSDLSRKIDPLENLKGGKLDIHSAIGKLPRPKGGFTPGKYKYMGPYNPLENQLEHDDNGNITKFLVQPYNEVDRIAAQHDVDYTICNNKNGGVGCKNEADRKMVSSLDQIPYGDMPKWGQVARFAIDTKQKLGMGTKNYPSRRAIRNWQKNYTHQ